MGQMYVLVFQVFVSDLTSCDIHGKWSKQKTRTKGEFGVDHYF
jgi:hypothetical protein